MVAPIFLSAVALGNVLNITCYRLSFDLVKTMAKALEMFSESNAYTYRKLYPQSSVRGHTAEDIVRVAFRRNLEHGVDTAEAVRILTLIRSQSRNKPELKSAIAYIDCQVRAAVQRSKSTQPEIVFPSSP